MSPGSVVIVSAPPPTVYEAGLSRTIASQRLLSRVVPSNASLNSEPPPPPPTSSPVRVKESNAATGAVAAALLNENRPIFPFAGRGAGRPTGVHAVPLVEYAPAMLSPVFVIR